MSRPRPAIAGVTIVSGGQTGADRAALDFAIEHALPHAGWCPRGRLAEDGVIDPEYNLQETPRRNYAERTEWNIRDSDATVVFSIATEATGGTALTLSLAKDMDKPLLHLAQESSPLGCTARAIRQHADRLNAFIDQHHAERLNIAGPRASQSPRIASFVRSVLAAALA